MLVYDHSALDIRRNTGTTTGTVTIVLYFKSLRNVCIFYIEKHPAKSADRSKTVEIDEAVLTWRKCYKGRLVLQHRFFGGT